MALIDQLKVSKNKQAGTFAASLLKGLGASMLELNTLLGIGAAESAWDWGAKGALGEMGFWQLEKEAIAPEDQTRNALTAARAYFAETGKFGQAPWKDLVEQDWKESTRFVRTTWQRGAKAKGSITRWLDSVKKTFDGGSLALQAGGKMRKEDADKAMIASMTTAGKLNLTQYIAWAGTEGSDTAALKKGDETYMGVMRAAGWDIPVSILGISDIPSDVPSIAETAVAGLGDFFGAPVTIAGKGIRGLFDLLADALKAIGSGAVSTLLPPILVVLAGAVAYKVLRSAWKKV